MNSETTKMNYKIKKLIDTVKKKPLQFAGVFIGYLILNAILNKTHVTVPGIFSAFEPWFAISFVLLNVIIIPILVSLTIIISAEKFKDLKNAPKKKGAASIVAIFGTLLGGACPGCFVGLFPAVIGLFGISATLGNLPLYGFEIQIISGIVLIFSLNYLTRTTVCKIN